MPAEYKHLLVVDTDRGVRTIILNRPERLNAVNPALAAEFPQAIAKASADDSVRVVVIAGAGRAFCAGLDLQEPARGASISRAGTYDELAWVGRWVLAVTSCDKPVIAAVHGPAAGAGLGLALCCDIRLVSESAKLTTGYVRRGLSPDAGVSWFLPRLIGQARAAEWLLTGRDVLAVEAERIGLVARVFSDESFADDVAAYADVLASGPPIAHTLTKRVLLASAASTLDEQLKRELDAILKTFATDDVKEAMAAFREKRTPVFRGS